MGREQASLPAYNLLQGFSSARRHLMATGTTLVELSTLDGLSGDVRDGAALRGHRALALADVLCETQIAVAAREGVEVPSTNAPQWTLGGEDPAFERARRAFARGEVDGSFFPERLVGTSAEGYEAALGALRIVHDQAHLLVPVDERVQGVTDVVPPLVALLVDDARHASRLSRAIADHLGIAAPDDAGALEEAESWLRQYGEGENDLPAPPSEVVQGLVGAHGDLAVMRYVWPQLRHLPYVDDRHDVPGGDKLTAADVLGIRAGLRADVVRAKLHALGGRPGVTLPDPNALLPWWARPGEDDAYFAVLRERMSGGLAGAYGRERVPRIAPGGYQDAAEKLAAACACGRSDPRDLRLAGMLDDLPTTIGGMADEAESALRVLRVVAPHLGIPEWAPELRSAPVDAMRQRTATMTATRRPHVSPRPAAGSIPTDGSTIQGGGKASGRRMF